MKKRNRKTAGRLPSRRGTNPDSLKNLRKGGGRKKGVPNKVTLEAKKAMSDIVDNPQYRAALLKRMIDGTAGAMEPICWYYAKGKPKETVKLEDNRTLAQLLVGDLPPEA